MSLREMIAKRNDVYHELSDGERFPARMEVYYQSLPYSDRIPDINVQRILFGYARIHQRFDECINLWIEAMNTLGPAISLFFSSRDKQNNYVNARFLSLVQGLETYHRRTTDTTYMGSEQYKTIVSKMLLDCPDEHREWFDKRLIHGNELTLAHRFKHLIEPFKSHFGSKDQRKKLIRLVVEKRNYWTHFSKESDDSSIDPIELNSLSKQLDVLFVLHLLSHIGFEQHEIESMIAKSVKLKRGLQGT